MTKKQPASGRAKPPASKRRKQEPEEEPDQAFDDSDIETSGSQGDDDSFPENSSEGSEDEQGSSDAEDSDDDGEVKEIQVDFEFFDPKEIDFHGLKALLSGYLNGEEFHSSGLVDAIIAEGDVGSVVKTAEDDDPIAVMTVLNTAKHKDSEFMKQIREFLLSKCPSSQADVKSKLQKAFDSAETGLIINDRMLNAHPKLGPPLVQFLMQEIQDRAEDPEDEDSKWFKFKRFLLATRVYQDPLAASDQPGSSKQHKKSASSSDGSSWVYLRPEDEYFHQHCAWSFTFPVEGRPVTKDGLVAHRLVLQIDAGQVGPAREAMDAIVGNMAAGLRAGEAGSDDDEEDESEEQEADEAEEEAKAPGAQLGNRKPGKGGKTAAGKGGKETAGRGSLGAASDIARMAAEAFAAAAAAGAGRGAAGKGKKKQKARAKAVVL